MAASISTANKNRLNKMNRAAQNVSLGDRLQYLGTMASGSLTVSAAEMNGSRVVVTPGIATIGGFIGQVDRSGSIVTHQMKFTAGSVAGTMIASSGSGYFGITAGDVITYVAFK
jgi:hypothetical protein